MADECRYPNMWHERMSDRVIEKQTARLGWRGGEATSDRLFGPYIDVVESKRIILRSMLAIQEHEQYIYNELGRTCHQARASLPKEVRERHGDRCIACALAYRACVDTPKYKRAVPRKLTVIEAELLRRRRQKRKIWRR